MARPIKRRRGAPSGLLLVILGAWGALIPFIGPYFDYSIGSSDTWHWTTNRLWLSVLPGAVTALGGLMMMFGATRRTVSTGALMATLAGIWFVVGPTVSVLWENGRPATGAALGGDFRRVIEWIGYFYGLGALVTALGAYEMGFMAALPVVDEPVRRTGDAVADDRPRRRSVLGRRRRRQEPVAAEPTGRRGDGARPADRPSGSDVRS